VCGFRLVLNMREGLDVGGEKCVVSGEKAELEKGKGKREKGKGKRETSSEEEGAKG